MIYSGIYQIGTVSLGFISNSNSDYVCSSSNYIAPTITSNTVTPLLTKQFVFVADAGLEAKTYSFISSSYTLTRATSA